MMTTDDSAKSVPEDWFSHALRVHEAAERQARSSLRSGAWARKRGKDGQVRDLKDIRDIVRSAVRVTGVPKACRVELAGAGLEGAAAAGFEDAPESFERPYIMLDKRAYETCPEGEVLDVYVGLGLHEAGHVLYTREGYRRMARCLSRERRRFDNLWEDERIEGLIRREARGFAPYIQEAKRALLERQELGRAVAGWDELPDLDKVNALIFAFIRCPYLVSGPMQAWTAISGECVFATLRGLFPDAPKDEADVEQFAARLEELWERLRRLYASDLPAGASAGGDERRERQQRADAEDRALEAATADGKTDLQEAVATLLDEAERREASGDTAGADALLEEAVRWEDSGDPATARADRRFGWPEGERLCQRSETIGRPLGEEEEKELRRLERPELTPGDAWEWGGERRTVITHPVPGDAARRSYAEASRDVRGHVAALRAALSVRLGERAFIEAERTRGRLDPRRLSLAPVTNRVFRQRRTRAAPGLALALLLDASGSMVHSTPPKDGVALRVGVLVAEALRDVPGVELEIYAHTSCGQDDRDCLVQYLFGKQNPDRTAIGAYGGWRENYDHQAILTAADLFMRNTANARRMLIAVSDGLPYGTGYKGKQAFRAAREAVGAVRRRGIRVLSVAIEDYASEAIFGAANVLRFLDLGRLVGDMRTLIGRLVRNAVACP